MVSRPAISFPILLIAVLLGCSGPVLIFPGGQLKGTPSEIPSDWAFTREISTIKLETRLEDPYSVNIWVVDVDDKLYVHAGAKRTAWVNHLKVDSAVRVSIDGMLYEMSATRVEDSEEFAKMADAYEVKYGRRPKNEHISEIYVYRLGPRS